MSENPSRPGLAVIEIDPGDDVALLRAGFETVALPLILAVSGVVGVSRWETSFQYEEVGDGSRVAVPAHPGYLAVIELDDVAVARSAAFLDAVGRDFGCVVGADHRAPAFEVRMSLTLLQLRERVNPEFASTTARGMMLVSLTPDRAHVDLFHEWYETVHLDELMSCPGFLRVRRYQALDGIPNFVALFELDSPEALEGERMRSLSGRSFDQLPPLTQRLVPHLTHNLLVIYANLD